MWTMPVPLVRVTKSAPMTRQAGESEPFVDSSDGEGDHTEDRDHHEAVAHRQSRPNREPMSRGGWTHESCPVQLALSM